MSGGDDWGSQSHDMIGCDEAQFVYVFLFWLKAEQHQPPTLPTTSKRLNHFLETLIVGIGRTFIYLVLSPSITF